MSGNESVESAEARIYDIRSTSLQSAEVNPQTLSLRVNDDGAMTRRIIDAEIVENPGQPDATVSVSLRHQRRGFRDGRWEDLSFNLATLKARQEVSLGLSAAETLRLFEHLRDLYALGATGVHAGELRVLVYDPDRMSVISDGMKNALEQLIDTHGDDVFSILDDIRPDLLTAALLTRQYRERSAALQEFENHLGQCDWSEGSWQQFFSTNPWIFGHGLDYRFLVSDVEQPNYGGVDITGHGAERGDFLMHTEANARFAVLVEIKRPDTPLLGGRRYRNGAWQLSDELVGGVSQVQANCEQWDTEGSRTDANRELQAELGVTTVLPEGILLIGQSAQLDSTVKKRTFERFRRSLWNPRVLTYDELLERARFLVGQVRPVEEPPDSW